MKMLIKDFDYLSPSITFYHNSSLSHSSILSGILSAISFIIIILYSIHFFLEFINHQNPDAFYYNRFVEDAGFFPINSSSIFHFINFKDNGGKNPGEKGFDFTYFRAIGIDRQFEGFYVNAKTLKIMDHWLYGKCNNDTDTKGISYLIDNEHFNESACIRKFYNSAEDKYYDVNEPNFKWPNLSHGNFNPNQTFYSVVVEKCQEDTLQLMFGNNLHCKSEIEMEEYFSYTHNIFFNFVDHSVDMLDFSDPNKKFMYKINTILDKEKYNVNHLNFNPTIIKTHKGFFLEKIEEEISFVYDRADVVINPIGRKKIYMTYRLWLNNKMQHYERFYKRFQDVIADVGGIAEFINYIAIFISYYYNNYIIIADTQILLSSFNNNFDKNIKVNNIINSRNINNLNIDNNSNNSNNSNIKIHITKFKSKKSDFFNDVVEKKEKEKDNLKSNYSNLIISSDNSKNQKIIKSDCNINFSNNKIEKLKDNEERKNIQINKKIGDKKREKMTFFNYLVYKIFCGNKYENIKVYEDFREKIISEEQLFKNYFYINKLKMVKIETNPYLS